MDTHMSYNLSSWNIDVKFFPYLLLSLGDLKQKNLKMQDYTQRPFP